MNPAEVGALLARGQPREALALAIQGVIENPADANWQHLLGAAQFHNGAMLEAVPALRRAVELAPQNPIAWNTLGAVLVELGDHAQAERALREALRIQADYREAMLNLAIALRRSARHDEAKATLSRLNQRWPDFVPAQVEFATALVESGDAQSALPVLGVLVTRYPGDARLLVLAAAAFQSVGDRGHAFEMCERALALPNLGAREMAAVARTFADLDRGEQAVELASRAAAMAPQSADVRAVAGDVLAFARRHGEAQEHYAAAAVHRPRDADVLGKLGLSSLAAGRLDAAADAFSAQLKAAPGLRTAHQNLASVMNTLGREDEAIATLMRALDAGHRDAEILATIVNLKGRVCDWDGIDALAAELREKALQPSDTPAHPQTALYLENVGAADQRTWAGNWARVNYPERPALAGERIERSGRLRLGYVSSDFHEHATAMLMIGMLEHHDRKRFEVFAYSSGPAQPSPMRERIAAAVDRFVDLRDQPIRSAAARIAEDRLDLLVDLGGYVKRARFEILASRPAQVQGHFLGFPGTTGAPFVDFFVGDAVTIPDGAERHFSERVLRMPHCYQPNDPRRPLPAASDRAAHGLPAKALVLCSFNQAVKIRPSVFAEWCRLLQALPDAVLWLLDSGEAVGTRLRAAAQRHGVDPSRIVFAGQVAPHEHLARLALADIAIDTFPYGSHTTASDAIWAGVPLLTRAGETFASRVAASVLTAAGCADWAFEDGKAAFDATVAMARDARLRSAGRARLEAARTRAPLFDDAAFARDFEGLLEAALRKE